MKKYNKDFLLTLLRLFRDNKIRYNSKYFSYTITKLDFEDIIKEIEDLKEKKEGINNEEQTN